MTQDVSTSGQVLSIFLGFSLALALVPVSVYFLSVQYSLSATKAAIAAAISANIILALYVYIAFIEDSEASEQQEKRQMDMLKETKKGQ